MLGALACTTRVEEGGGVVSLGETLSVGDGSVACGTAPLLKTSRTFENLNTTVDTYLCPKVEGSYPQVSVRKSDGLVVDAAALALEEAATFKSVHSSIDPALRKRFVDEPGAAFEAHLWFRTHETPFTKEALANNSALLKAALKSRQLQIQAEAQAMAAIAQSRGLEVLSLLNRDFLAPYLHVKGTSAALEQVGQHPHVWQIIGFSGWKDVAKAVPTEDYFYTTRESWLDFLGADGSGITVANLEDATIDSSMNLPGSWGGNCAVAYPGPPIQLPVHCHCPPDPADLKPVDPTKPFIHAHPRMMLGIVRSTSLSFGGMAKAAKTIAANYRGDACTNYGPDRGSSAVNWAIGEGASVFLHASSMHGAGSPQTWADLFLDYVASDIPWPWIAAASFNDSASRTYNNLRNGLVVGGAFETNGSDRGSVFWQPGSSFINDGGASGMEMPHIVNIRDDLSGNGPRTAAYLPTGSEATGGTSASTAVTAGMLAALQDYNPSIKVWSELVIPAMMASATRNTVGPWLSLNDSLDDRDGAGLPNGSSSRGFWRLGPRSTAATRQNTSATIWARFTLGRPRRIPSTRRFGLPGPIRVRS